MRGECLGCVLHERAAVAHVPLPCALQFVTPAESAPEVVAGELREAVPDAVDALKKHPVAFRQIPIVATDPIDGSGRERIHTARANRLREIRLDHTVVAAGLIGGRAGAERGSKRLRRRVCCETDGMGVHVAIAHHALVDLAGLIEGMHGGGHAVGPEDGEKGRVVTLHPRCGVRSAVRTNGGRAQCGGECNLLRGRCRRAAP